MHGASESVEINENVVAITGGHLGSPSWRSSSGAWVTKVLHREECRYIIIDKADIKFVQFVAHKFGMLDRLRRLRNEKVAELMKDMDQNDDLAADAAGGSAGPAPLKRRRVELADMIPCSITVTVVVGGEARTCKMLAAWSGQHRLAIALSSENLELLLAQPDSEPQTPWAPEIPCDTPNVTWRDTLQTTLVTRYKQAGVCKEVRRMVPKKKRTDEEWAARVEAACRTLQEVYLKNTDDGHVSSPSTPCDSSTLEQTP